MVSAGTTRRRVGGELARRTRTPRAAWGLVDDEPPDGSHRRDGEDVGDDRGEQGLDAFSMSRVAEGHGTTAGPLPTHIGNKDQLLLAPQAAGVVVVLVGDQDMTGIAPRQVKRAKASSILTLLPLTPVSTRTAWTSGVRRRRFFCWTAGRR